MTLWARVRAFRGKNKRQREGVQRLCLRDSKGEGIPCEVLPFNGDSAPQHAEGKERRKGELRCLVAASKWKPVIIYAKNNH